MGCSEWKRKVEEVVKDWIVHPLDFPGMAHLDGGKRTERLVATPLDRRSHSIRIRQYAWRKTLRDLDALKP